MEETTKTLAERLTSDTTLNEDMFKDVLKELKIYGENKKDKSFTARQNERIQEYKQEFKKILKVQINIEELEDLEFPCYHQKPLFRIEGDEEQEEKRRIGEDIKNTTRKIRILNRARNEYQKWKRKYAKYIILQQKQTSEDPLGFYITAYEKVKALALLIKEEIEPFKHPIKVTKEIRKGKENELSLKKN